MPQVNEFYWTFFSLKILIIMTVVMLFINLYMNKGIFTKNKTSLKTFSLFF